MISADVLHRVGIDQSPDEFAAAVRQVIEEMPAVERRAPSTHELTGAEIAALKRGGFDLEPHDYGANDPYLKGKAIYAVLVASAFTVAEVAAMLRVDESRVRQRLAKRTLYGVKREGAWRLPRFQFAEGHPIPGIEAVIPALDPTLNPVAVYNWFMLPDVDLAVGDAVLSPREWLLRGENAAAVGRLAAEL